MAATASTVPTAPSGPVPTPPPTPPPAVPSPSPALAGSVRLTGSNRVPNVRTLSWVARGFTKVVGDVEVDTGDVSGTLAVGGRLVARELDLGGTDHFDGEVRLSGDLRSAGALRIAGGLSARSAQLKGTVEVGGAVKVDELLQWRGSLEVGQDVRADTVIFQGRLAIKGKLTAQSISGEVESLSSVGEIGADWIEIRLRKPRIPIFLLPPPPWHELAAQRIEAKEVHLSGVRVRYLKADRIFLGPDSHVEFVEGTVLQRHKNAHVGPESESSPPPGLSR